MIRKKVQSERNSRRGMVVRDRNMQTDCKASTDTCTIIAKIHNTLN